jgi:hypothetical protein
MTDFATISTDEGAIIAFSTRTLVEIAKDLGYNFTANTVAQDGEVQSVTITVYRAGVPQPLGTASFARKDAPAVLRGPWEAHFETMAWHRALRGAISEHAPAVLEAARAAARQILTE